VLHFHRFDHHQGFTGAHRLPHFGYDGSDDARERRREPPLRGGGREFLQARVFERDLPVVAGAPEMEARGVRR